MSKDGGCIPGLRQHGVQLPSVMRLVIEEMAHDRRRRIRIPLPLAVHVDHRPRYKTFARANQRSFDSRILTDPRLAHCAELVEQDRIQRRRGCRVPLEPLHPDPVR